MIDSARWTPKRKERTDHLNNTPTMNQTDQLPSRKTVSAMPWIDSDGDTGFYTGDVNTSNLPDGMGMMRYDDGPIVKGRWKEGEMVIEDEEEDSKPPAAAPQQQPPPPSDGGGDGEGGEEEELKKRQLQQFHERNQEFLRQTQQQEYHQQQEREYQQQQQMQFQQQQSQLQGQFNAMELEFKQQAQDLQENHRVETEELHTEVYTLQEQVRQLSHELRITQDTHALNRDQSHAEIEMLQTELDRQNSRHEQIVSSLRNRLVESEMARMKMQDQLSSRMEEDTQREEELKSRWTAMSNRVVEDKKWVDEQMAYWKESMDEHRRRLSGAKVRGGLDASLGGGGDGGNNRNRSSKSRNLRASDGSNDSEETKNRRLSQRRLWGAHVEGHEEEEDEEEARLFGK